MKLTTTQIDGLRRIRDRGPLAWCEGNSREGGSVSRMFDRMVGQGLCTPPPYEITERGRAALAETEKARKR
jgi:hypothetical protein